MNMETVATLGLTNKMMDGSVSVNTASGQNMGVTGGVYINFKIGKTHSFTHRFVVCECLSRPFILAEDFLWKHNMTLNCADGNKHCLGFRDDIIMVASQACTDEPLKLRNAIRIPLRSFAIAPAYCSQMFTGKAATILCDELKCKFPNTYMESMQMANTEGKSRDNIPYMIINLNYGDQVYIGKDMPVAYIKDEDKSCEYLEVNETVEPVKGINWCPPRNRKIVTSDLVNSPAQVTEHCHF